RALLAQDRRAMAGDDEWDADRRVLTGPRLKVTRFPQGGESAGECRGVFPVAGVQIQSLGNHAKGLDGTVSGQIVSTPPRQRLRLAIELSGLLQDGTQAVAIGGLGTLRRG